MASATLVILVDARPGAAAWAEHRLRQLERRWSRFIETSDVTLLNNQPDTWVPVGPDTIRLIEAMQLAETATAGGYNPTFLHQLLTAGYTASIDDADHITVAVESAGESHDVRDVRFDHAASCVRLPEGLSLDPGGIGKGFAADLVATELLAGGTAGALVSVGGDIAAAGIPPTPDGWRVHVSDPFDPSQRLLTLAVSDGGIATSSTRSRRWSRHGIERHHAIDPTTGMPSTTDLAAVTVVANAGWLAEAHATAALLRGSRGVIDYLESHSLTGLTVDADGSVRTTAHLSMSTLEGASR